MVKIPLNIFSKNKSKKLFAHLVIYPGKNKRLRILTDEDLLTIEKQIIQLDKAKKKKFDIVEAKSSGTEYAVDITLKSSTEIEKAYEYLEGLQEGKYIAVLKGGLLVRIEGLLQEGTTTHFIVIRGSMRFSFDLYLKNKKVKTFNEEQTDIVETYLSSLFNKTVTYNMDYDNSLIIVNTTALSQEDAGDVFYRLMGQEKIELEDGYSLIIGNPTNDDADYITTLKIYKTDILMEKTGWNNKLEELLESDLSLDRATYSSFNGTLYLLFRSGDAERSFEDALNFLETE